MTQYLTYGSTNQGIDLTFTVINNEVEFQSVEINLGGVRQPIEHLTDAMGQHLKEYVLSEMAKQARYRALEQLFKDDLRKTVIIENERAYDDRLWEYNKLTEGDIRMNDLNGDLKAFNN